MKIVRLSNNCATIACIGLSCSPSFQQNEITSSDHLNQWNEGLVKASILSFLNTVFNETCPDFVAVKDRVAVFDKDGTILLEKPNLVNFDMIIMLMKNQIASNPVLTQKQLYKAIHEQDWDFFDTLCYFGDDYVYSILMTARVAYTEVQYSDFILEYFKAVTDKRFSKLYNKLVYVPVVLMKHYLQYIVSGSDPQFTRTFYEDVLNMPTCNAIGSTILTEWVETDTGSNFIHVYEFVEPINDEGGKPVNIQNKVGKLPLIVIGNSAGDYHMLGYIKNASSSMQIILNHDDQAREYEYETEKIKKLCQKNVRQEISVKSDFK